MASDKNNQLRIVILLLGSITLACGLTSPAITSTPTQEVFPSLSATDPLPTVTGTPVPTETLTPLPTESPTQTATPMIPGLDYFLGYWRGRVTAQGEGTESTEEEKVFQILSASQPGALTLDVLQANTMRFVHVPVYDYVEGTVCFTLRSEQSSQADQMYTACFTPQPDGTLDYFGTAPLWGESGRLQRLSSEEGVAIREAVLASCQHNLPSRLSAGGKARVTYSDGRALNMRASPEADAKVLLAIPEGKEFDVVNGPVCEDGYWWWFISIPGEGMGWVAEGDETSYFIEPWS